MQDDKITSRSRNQCFVDTFGARHRTITLSLVGGAQAHNPSRPPSSVLLMSYYAHIYARFIRTRGGTSPRS